MSFFAARYLAVSAFTLAVLCGCTTHVRSERIANTEVKQYLELQLYFKDAKPPGRYVFSSHRDEKAPKPPEFLLERAAKEVPQLRALAQAAVETYLRPELEKRGVSVQASSEIAVKGLLSIQPIEFVGECGRHNSICQTSVLFDVSLINIQTRTMVWNAQINVGAPMGLSQTEAVAQNFYGTVIDRLVSAKLIP